MSLRPWRTGDPWDDQEHWSFSMVAEFHLHDAAHCRAWYGNTYCLRHAQDGAPVDED